MGRCSIPLKLRKRNEARAAVGSAAKGDEQSGDDADHGESVAAEPDRNYCHEPDT